MSVARGGINAGHYYSNIIFPWCVNINFTVDSTNGNGLGIRSLKSNGFVQNVFMNTSASLTGTVATTANAITAISGGTSSLKVGMPVQGTGIPTGTVITGITSSSAVAISQTPTGNHSSETITYQGSSGGNLFNPNPLAGFALIQFKQNFNYYLGGFSGFVSPIVSPTTAVTSGLTAGQAYVITVVGTTTLAEWQSIGLTQGLTPTVGQSFIATATGTGGSHTGKVGLPGVSSITSIEVVGDPNQSISNSSIAVNAGALVLVQFLSPTVSGSAFDTPYIPTAPANNSVVGMTFFFDGSSVTVDGI
jgi:hypothetical protein